MAETEAKRKLLAASVCFGHRPPSPRGQPVLTPAIEGSAAHVASTPSAHAGSSLSR
jgi:hypothetical protein